MVADEDQDGQQDEYEHDTNGNVDGLMVTAIHGHDDGRRKMLLMVIKDDGNDGGDNHDADGDDND